MSTGWPAALREGARRETDGVRGVPDAGGPCAPVPGHRGELFVQIPEALLGRVARRDRREQPFDATRRLRHVAHRRSSCDSTPCQSARSAAREARNAARPVAVTE